MKIKRFTVRQLWARMSEEGGGDAGGGAGGAEGTFSNSAFDDSNKPSETPSFAEFVPEGFRDKPYIQELMKNENPHAELFNQFDGLQKQLGQKKLGVPDENTSAEDVAKFWADLGVHDEASKYEIPDADFGEDNKEMSEFANALMTDELKADLQQMFFDAKIPQEAASALTNKFNELMFKHNESDMAKNMEAMKNVDADFEQRAAKELGDKYQKILDDGKAMIDKYSPDGFKDTLHNKDNSVLIGIAATLQNFMAEQTGEDTILTKDINTQLSHQEISERGRELMAHPAFQDVMHPQHEEYKRRVNENYSLLGR